jgi:glutamyl-tRNA(Gln) amidotransferase subunit E
MEAVEISIELCMAAHVSLVSELHVARKQYLDGSIPAGFQRTLIIGVGGWVPYKDGRIRIRQVSLEEDSCREISDIGHERIYRTDRLGMPITELVTEPEMHTPQDVADVCDILRHLSRSTGRYRTGPGTGRQDVNVSFRGGERNEIKGVCGTSKIPLLVHNEAFRQVGLLEIKAELADRGVTEESFECHSGPLERVLENTGSGSVRWALANGQRVAGIVLRNYHGLVGHPLGETRTFYDELSDRVRVIACLDEMPNILSSEAGRTSLADDEWELVRNALGATDRDAVIVTWGRDQDLQTAVQEIEIRAREAIVGVPLETRQPMPDGTTRFERILPGPERMYPDTDLPPIEVTDETIAKIEARLNARPWEREAAYGNDHPAEVAARLAISRFAGLYDALTEGAAVQPAEAATLVLVLLKSLERKAYPVHRIDADTLVGIYQAAADGIVVLDAVPLLVEDHLSDLDRPLGDLLSRFTPATEREVASALERALANTRGRAFECDHDRHNWAMGQIMKTLRGRVGGADVRTQVEAGLAEVSS